MKNYWEREFDKRFPALDAEHQRPKVAIGPPLKFRSMGGCFHREQAPVALMRMRNQTPFCRLGE